MKKAWIIFILLVILVSSVSAKCEEGKVNINTAPQKELEKLNGIGPVKAQAIIDTRPFNSVDDLINVWGIGEATLTRIKEQSLACVDEKDIVSEDSEKEIVKEENPVFEKIPVTETSTQFSEPEKVVKISLTKDIKTENNKEISSRNKYAIYGFFIFCVLILFLFFIRSVKIRKNVLE